MSSGPSALKLKPRAAVSSCIELTPRSSSTPRGGSSTRAGISRKSACSKRTRSPKGARRAPARARASASRSKATSRPPGALRRSTSSACPPRPTVPSTQRPPGLTASSSRASASRTGSWPRAPSLEPTSDPEPGEHAAVLLRERLLLEQPLGEPLLVPHREMVLEAEHAHVAHHARALAQELRQHHAPLLVHRHRLAEEVHAVQEALLGGIGGGHLGQAALDLEPHRHRVEAHVLARDAGDEELRAVLLLDEHTEPVGDLESPLVVDARRMVAPQHAKTAFCALPSTEAAPLRDGSGLPLSRSPHAPGRDTWNHFFPQNSTSESRGWPGRLSSAKNHYRLGFSCG